jgi:hypothetical protein
VPANTSPAVTSPKGTSPSGSQPEPPRYQLAREPDGRSWTARENLADILERELLGPMYGPEEVIDGTPDAVYLVGRIAPFKLTGTDENPADGDSAEPPADVGDATDAEEGRGVPMTSVDEGAAGGEDDNGGAGDEPQRRGLMIPASMGLRCQVPADLDAFTVTASWGMYEAVTETGPDKARVIRRHKRTPVEISKKIAVADLQPGTTAEITLRDEVVLRIDRHDESQHGCRLIEIALCNDRETPRKIPVESWLYQTKLTVSADRGAVFLPTSDPLLDDRWEPDDELRRLNLQYRDRLEFAIGRTCSVDWHEVAGTRRASKVWTTWLPACETPQVTAEEIGDILLDMKKLAQATTEQLRNGLSPIVERYGDWLTGQEDQARQLPEHLRGEGLDAVTEARQVQRQLADGLEHLLTDPDALRCFRFMNEVMAEQRIHSQVARRRTEHPDESLNEARAAVLAGKNPHSWFTFQLAFVLMQIPLLTSPAAARRSGRLAAAQLLFFPTGGGKTEAYLGLAAYAFAIRRLQKVIETPDGPLDGRDGVTVLMRYTLRLLTAQQFQRATALVCAAELARRRDESTWGTESFRIGLWVGTDVSPKRYTEAETQIDRANRSGGGYRPSVLQVQRCPWCGARIEVRNLKARRDERRVYVYCGDELGECPFAEGGAVADGLPVLTVDEEIYRLAPAFLIATVDKFARLAREGEAASLFGYVSRRCERHGYVHPDYAECDIKDGSKHPQTRDRRLPSAAVRPAGRLRPPDLIIQDELHLITGALGTTVGLFEVAVDELCSWPTSSGAKARPLVVASTATARNAPDQVRALYGRGVTIFPPLVLDAGHTFFSTEVPVSEKSPGRRYIGLATTGIRLTTAEIRVAEVLLAAGQLLLDRSDPDRPGTAADPYLTLIGYYNTRRELAGMARYLSDDIRTALIRRRPWSRLPSRSGTAYGDLHVAELTSRVSSSDITATLDQMGLPFDPRFDSSAGKRELRALREAKKPVPARETMPFDVVLATSMLQVGVDVTRLGLMLIVGQPKNTAEYIQASSRVGRDRNDRPGLVVTLGNWARPRDQVHFEQFRYYHETFYARVEPLSVTPFSLTALDRGLDGVLVSAARVRNAAVRDGLSPERGAGRVEPERDFLLGLIDTLAGRTLLASDEEAAGRARRELGNRLDHWVARRKHLADQRLSLVYERVSDPGKVQPLMMSAENARSRVSDQDAPPFVVANSMREVQPEINLLVSPIKENLIYIEPPGTPQWAFPPEESS